MNLFKVTYVRKDDIDQRELSKTIWAQSRPSAAREVMRLERGFGNGKGTEEPKALFDVISVVELEEPSREYTQAVLYNAARRGKLLDGELVVVLRHIFNRIEYPQ